MWNPQRGEPDVLLALEPPVARVVVQVDLVAGQRVDQVRRDHRVAHLPGSHPRRARFINVARAQTLRQDLLDGRLDSLRGILSPGLIGVPGGTTARATMRELLKHHRAVATVFGLTAGGALSFYVFTTYAQKFLVNTTGFSKQEETGEERKNFGPGVLDAANSPCAD